MKASLDTDIVIHLYGSGKEGLIFNYFDQLYMHAYLYERELKLKSVPVYKKLTTDVVAGRIEIVTTKDLVDMGIQGLFERYKRDYEYLFDSGELYAVSMAKAMGLMAFVSDDTKEYGPHETLVKELIEDVMPFAFYELLFLNYLSSEINLVEMHREFDEVTSQTMNLHPMKFRTKMLLTARRFSHRHGTERDYSYVRDFCQQHKVDYRVKMRGLKEYLSGIE
ncbi:MAG: hypothetical protein KGZ63_02370 [Clostridiales bacterium]|jgi:hypothetical protein|nr:hypothetical protein [Clostridiales bacterium]